MLGAVSETLEELNLSENAMERTDFDLIMPVLARMPRLRAIVKDLSDDYFKRSLFLTHLK